MTKGDVTGRAASEEGARSISGGDREDAAEQNPAASVPPGRPVKLHSRSTASWNSRGLKVAVIVLVVVVAVFAVSGPVVRWVGRTAGIDALPYRETAAFRYPAAASAGVTGGSHVRIAVTVIRQSVIPWSAVVGGFPVSLGAVDVRPDRVSYVLVPVPVVRSRTWLTIHIGGLPAPLRVEVKP